jgi:hypothetical protein
MDLLKGLCKITNVFEVENIPYMLIGSFAASFYNRYRYTADIDCVLPASSENVLKIIKHFPEWSQFSEVFKDKADVENAFHLIVLLRDTTYSRIAFERRRKAILFDVVCNIASPEDLIVAYLIGYKHKPSGKHWEDLEFLIKLEPLDIHYLRSWTEKLSIQKHGLF